MENWYNSTGSVKQRRKTISLFPRREGGRGLGTLLALLCLSAPVASAQTEFEQWQKKEAAQLQQFRDVRDKAFTEFLQQEWRAMQASQGLVPDEKPKPVQIPVYQPPVVAPKDTALALAPVEKAKPSPEPTPEPEQDIGQPPSVDESRNAHTLRLTFFGAPLTIRYGGGLKAALGNPINEHTISAFWRALSLAPNEDCLAQAQYYKERMRLNDWGYCQLLYAIGNGLYPDSQNASRLFVWFMLAKSGYLAKVGYQRDQVYLLLPAANVVYEVPYFTFEHHSQKFYVIPFEQHDKPVQGAVYTYDGNYPGATSLIDLKVDRVLRFGNGAETASLTFTHRGKRYQIPVTRDRSAVSFFESYPHTNYEVYFAAPLSAEASSSLLPALKSVIAGQPETEAVNTLLHFVQTAFPYKTDDEQFGWEKVLFPDETLYYPYSDCEDRSVLFAYLVRHLVGLEVIGLDYPGHIATAVRFSSDVSGDTVTYHNTRYVICDPTYVNADIGMGIPQMQDITPEVIRIGQ